MAAATGKTNWFVIGVSSAVVVALVALGGLVFWLNNQALDPGEFPETAAVDQETGAIRLGEGDGPLLQLYADFMCVHCADFESTYGEQINGLAASGDISYEFIPVGALDGAEQYSSRAANAVYIVAENAPELTIPYISALFGKRPVQTGNLTDEELIDLAYEVGVSKSEGFEKDITERRYDDLVQYNTQNIPENPSSGRPGTPTVIWEGEYTELTAVPALLASLQN